MSKARLVITAVVIEGRSQSEVARAYGVSQSWISRLIARYRLEGEVAFAPRSRRPHTSPHRLPQNTIELIIELREKLASKGLDHGPHTIAWHLQHHHGLVVSVNSIHRHLRAGGYIDPQPHKRPKSSYIRFAAEQPNERWQADFTHWWLADHTHVEILNWIDDHARYALSATAHRRVTGPIVLAEFRKTVAAHGVPASTLTDNGMVFTTRFSGGKGGRNSFEHELHRLGITQINSTPNHPTTCGKIERFHQTQKKWLTAHPAATVTQLQTLLEEFTNYYNTVRPHRAIDRATPIQAFNARPKANPTGYLIPAHCRVRTDTIDAAGVITVRYNGRLHHIGLGKRRTGTKVTVLIDDRDIRVLDRDTGQLIRKLVLDPTRDYQPRGVKCGNPPENRLKV